jgi:hypothetical protein
VGEPAGNGWLYPEVQEFRSSGVQEFRSSGVQEFRSSGPARNLSFIPRVKGKRVRAL